MLRILLPAIMWLSLATSAHLQAAADRDYPARFDISLDPDTEQARVSIVIERNRWVRKLTFKPGRLEMTDLQHNGELEQGDGVIRWYPPKHDAHFSYKVPVKHARRPGAFDAYITDDWILARGEDLVPSISAAQRKGARAQVSLNLDVPEHWTSADAAWEPSGPWSFKLPDTGRHFERPKGWFIAGKLASRLETMGTTDVIISAPRGHEFRPMEMLAMLNIVWPQIAKALPMMPSRLLVTGADEPFWRGGLSGPDSLFIHSRRPLISENGTSTLLHEIFHVITGLHGRPSHDWIAEGMAEYYSVEWLFRAGAYSQSRRQSILDGLAEWGADVETLLQRRSSGPVTARAAVLFSELDAELQKRTEGRASLDNLLAELPLPGDVDLEDLQIAFQTVTGKQSSTLQDETLLERLPEKQLGRAQVPASLQGLHQQSRVSKTDVQAFRRAGLLGVR